MKHIYQQILTQLDNLYRPQEFMGKTYYGSFMGEYSAIYDFLESQGTKIELEEEVKKELYKTAVKKFNERNKRWIAECEDKEWLKKKLHEYYKSELVKKYLMDIYLNHGSKMVLVDEEGKELKMLKFV